MDVVRAVCPVVTVKTLTRMATEMAGNKANVIATCTVVYAFADFSPVLNVAKGSQSVPLTFRLQGREIGHG